MAGTGEMPPEGRSAPTEQDPLPTLIARFTARQYAEAESLAEQLVAHDEHSAPGWKILAYAKLAQGKAAAPALMRALRLQPNDAELHTNLGNELRRLGQHQQAIISYRMAIALAPGSAVGHFNLGAALQDERNYSEAVQVYREAIRLKPEFAEAYHELGSVLLKLGRLDEEVVDNFRHAVRINPELLEDHSNLLFYGNYLSNRQPEKMLADARRYGDLVARRARPHTAWPNSRDTGRALRIGLVSGDLRHHPVAFFLEGVMSALADCVAGRLEFFAYSNHQLNDEQTKRIKAYCTAWHAVPAWSDAVLAEQIRADRIDILLDLSGHTNLTRLPVFAWKAAPVQAAWLGYYATTGVAAIDYVFADPWVVTEEGEAWFTEKIWRLPEVFSCFTAPQADSASESVLEVSPPPALQNGWLTFGSFNNVIKMNDAVLALWARILHALPESRLFLKARTLAEALEKEKLIARFAALGIPSTRLILEGHSPRAELLAAYGRVDIALDPFPYTGCTTTAEALWMGVPVLTLLGQQFLGRQSASLLHNAGLPQWVAVDAEDYVARAVAYAGDLSALARLRLGLRRQVLASPVFDAPRFARYFEEALREMWARWCASQNAMPPGRL